MRGARFASLNLPFAIVLSVFLSACSRKPDKSLVPAGSLIADSIHFQYAVYLLKSPVPAEDPMSAIHEALAKKYPDLKLVDEIPKEPEAMLIRARLQKNGLKEYPPPDMKSLHYFGRGISNDQALALQKSDEVLILDFGHPKDQVWTALRAANMLVEEIARRTGGLVWDEETREVFSPDAWHKKRLAAWTTGAPDVSTQTTIHAYPNGEYVRAITLGMTKLGLPDVVVEDFSWASNAQVGNLINLFCQSIAEGKTSRKPGEFKLDLKTIINSTVRDGQVKSLKANAAAVGCLTLRHGKWEEGDPQNRLIQLAPDKYSGDDVHARQEAMTSSFFGWEDSVAKVHHNEELLAASAEAKAKLPELQQAFTAGLQPGEFIDLKAPFRTSDGGTEWMWVEVNSWRGDKIKGLLDNEPSYIPDLHAGQVVEIRQEDVFDYIRHYPDKHTDGNTTGDIIRKLDKDQTATQPAKQVVPACDAD